jgi:hypothetical protein
MGLSVAFDLPTHRGYDSDHPRVMGACCWRCLQTAVTAAVACSVQCAIKVCLQNAVHRNAPLELLAGSSLCSDGLQDTANAVQQKCC